MAASRAALKPTSAPDVRASAPSVTIRLERLAARIVTTLA
jgi:hypothetical protein